MRKNHQPTIEQIQVNGEDEMAERATRKAAKKDAKGKRKARRWLVRGNTYNSAPGESCSRKDNAEMRRV